MKSKPSDRLSPAQMEVMELIRSRGEAGAGVADVWKTLSDRRSIARNTVQTTLARLHERGWLRAREDGNAFVYTAARPRGKVVAGMLTRLIDTAFGGSLSGLVAAAIESPGLSREEAKRIRALIDEAAPSEDGSAGRGATANPRRGRR